ncbi:MAG: hypothetical protein M1537_03600 [Nitrospirae bacterium]|nr:hypothetical protein [Nitrospirota bacterium]
MWDSRRVRRFRGFDFLDVPVFRDIRTGVQKNTRNYATSAPGPGSGDQKGGKKLIVDEISIRGTRVQASAGFMQGKTISVSLPDIVLRNIGRAQGGIPPGELGQTLVGALKAKLEGAVNFDALAKSVGTILNKAGGILRGLFGN